MIAASLSFTGRVLNSYKSNSDTRIKVVAYQKGNCSLLSEDALKLNFRARRCFAFCKSKIIVKTIRDYM